jgi:hypothetical protein
MLGKWCPVDESFSATFAEYTRDPNCTGDEIVIDRKGYDTGQEWTMHVWPLSRILFPVILIWAIHTLDFGGLNVRVFGQIMRFSNQTPLASEGGRQSYIVVFSSVRRPHCQEQRSDTG